MRLIAEGSNVWHQIIWNPDPGGNIEHMEEHGLSVEDVEHVLANPEKRGTSRSSGNSCVFGHTPDGTYIIVVYEAIDSDTIVPITAYELGEPP
jgi:uncharacterized DUF497 family protein